MNGLIVLFLFWKGGAFRCVCPRSIGHWPTWTWAELVYIKSAIQLEFFIAEIMIILEGYGDWVCVDFVSKLFSLYPYIIYVFDGCLFCLLFYFQLNFFFRILQRFPCDIEVLNTYSCVLIIVLRVLQNWDVSSTTTASTNWVTITISTSHTAGSYRIGSLSLVFKS